MPEAGEVRVFTFDGDDGATVVQIDTNDQPLRLRVNINDGTVYDGDPNIVPSVHSLIADALRLEKADVDNIGARAALVHKGYGIEWTVHLPAERLEDYL